MADLGGQNLTVGPWAGDVPPWASVFLAAGEGVGFVLLRELPATAFFESKWGVACTGGTIGAAFQLLGMSESERCWAFM